MGFIYVSDGIDDALALHLDQILDAWTGVAGKGVPFNAININDPINFAISARNLDPTNSRVMQLLKADGTVLFQCDASGVKVSPDGTLAGVPVTTTATQTLTNKTIDFSTNTVQILRGTLAARPAAGVAGRVYLVTDETPAHVYVDNGSAWVWAGAPTFQEPALAADATLVANTLTTLVTTSSLSAGTYRVIGQITVTNPTAGNATIEGRAEDSNAQVSGSSELTIVAGTGGFLVFVGYHTLAAAGTISLKAEANAALVCKALTSVFSFAQATHLAVERIA